MFERKRSFVSRMHSDYCRLEGRTVNQWLAEPNSISSFFAALERKGWIKRGHDPAESRFWQLVEGPTAIMFGVFRPYEKQLLHDWIAAGWQKSRRLKAPEQTYFEHVEDEHYPEFSLENVLAKMAGARHALPEGLRDVLGWNRPFTPTTLLPDDLAKLMQANVIEYEGNQLRSTVRFSTLGDWTFLHSGYPTVAADAVFFGPDSYRFAHALQAHLQRDTGEIRHAVEIGSGTGIGAIVIATARRSARVMAVDINDLALRYTAINVALAGHANVSVKHSDVLQDVTGTFDLIVANPPYMLDASERTYRHGGGVSGEGLSLRIIEESLPRLAAGGFLLLYTGVAVAAGEDRFYNADWPDYERYLDLLLRTGVRPDVDCWWAIRPSRRYPTVELRIADGCPRLEDGLCIAALFYEMVTHCIEVGREINLLTRETHWVTQENLWRAMRYGRDGRFIDLSSLAPLSAREWLFQLQARFELADVHIDQAVRILTTGSSADQQLKVYDQAVTRGLAHELALQDVVDLLVNQTAQPAL
ncbi:MULTISPECIES: glutamate-cysteine ligase family protein [Pseudomonas]|nr:MULTISPECIES: glutamate-cysteine ligase family protein [Pseudomonas]